MHGSLHLTHAELADLGYKDLSHIGETDVFRIFRAQMHDKQAVLIKAPVSSHPSEKLIHQLEHEFEITSGLNPEYVVRPGKIERGTSLTALILEDCACLPLSELLQAPLEIGRFLTLAVGITSALAEIHRGGLVHKDIAPANIFVTAEGKVKLSGFGIASRLPRERQTLAHPQEIAGTLAYMAPEQTGRMNRSIDTRSDLYALGVVFYRMLTGQLPFAADDPMQWVHCHIAIKPKSPQQQLSTIPAMLSKIVMKLLAKAAEERYQTAEGLKLDLQHCQEEWLERESIEAFELGGQDIPHQLVIPEKLYGRTHEVKRLLNTVDRVVNNGDVEMLLVSGYAGIGKSALISEMQRTLVLPNTLYAEGKFDQYKRDTPYTTLSHALQTLVRHILGRGEREIAQWRQEIKLAVEPNGRLVTDLVPDLVTLIGEQPVVAEVPPQDAENRFNNVIRRLLEVFARSEHPLLLFLDDLQWFDSASLRLLEHLLTQPGLKHLLLLGAYRDNEVGQTHPLRRTIEVLRNRGVRLSEIVLKPLRINETCQLIVDTLHADEERVLPLANLVQEKTGGNPFFVNQFLTSLAEENLLAFDSQAREWTWNLNAIRNKGYSDNVVDLMLEKLSGLPDETQQALKQLACLGTVTEIDILAEVSDQSKAALDTALWSAVQAGLVVRDKTSYRFLHDRVQEAAYALIPDQQRSHIHLAIGRQLACKSSGGKHEDMLFDVVNHLNRGAELITDPAEIMQLAELNAAAGRKASASIAYATARELFSTAAGILSEDAWYDRYEFQFALYSDWAVAEFLYGDYARAEFVIEKLLARAGNKLDMARAHMLRMHCYPITGRFDDALVAGIEALRLLGLSVPDDAAAVSQAIASEAKTLQENLQTHSIRDMPQAPEATDLQARILIELLTGIAGPAYIGSRPELYPLFAYMNLNRIFQHGVTKEACHAFSAYAVLQASSLGDLVAAYESSLAAISLSERFAEPGILGSVLYLHGNHVNFWLNPLSSDFPILERGFAACIDGGNLAFANYIGYSIVWQAIERGDRLGEVLELSRKYADFALQSINEPIHQSIVLQQQFVKCLMGETDGEISFSDETIDEASSTEAIDRGAFTCGLAYYHNMKMLAAYLMGDDAAALSHADRARQVQSSVLSQPMQAMFHFLDGMILAGGCDGLGDKQRQQSLQTLSEDEQKLAFWAENAPANFACKHALVAAEIAVLKGDTLAAEQLFERACETARASSFIHWQAIASEAAARFYTQRGLETVARVYLGEARDCYQRWGASAKVRQLERQHGWLQSREALGSSSLNHHLDATALIKASQQLSGEVELTALIKALMTITLESAGADRGLLLLKRDRGFELEVEATATDSAIQVQQIHTPISQTECAETVVNRAINTHRTILIDDTAQPGEYSADAYFRDTDAKSICAIPLLRQDKLSGVLYLENSQTPGVFTHQRTAILDVLAAQAAISLENANLYQELIDSETQYRDLVQTVQAAIVVHAADTHILTTNTMAQDLLGLSEAQLLGKSAIDPDWHFLHEDGSVMPVEDYPVNQVLAADSALHNIIVGIHRPDREGPVWALVSALPIYDEAQNITRVIVSFSDITERKQAEQQLVASEQLFRTLVENSPDHIARYDLNLRRVYINPALENQFTVPRDKIVGQTSKFSSPLLDPERYMANLREAIKSGREVSDETAYRTRADEVHWASSRFAPEFDPDGKIQSVLVISNDITKQKLAELERQAHTHFLESLDRINRTLQLKGDIEQIMQKALDELLDIFACDRAFLLYPCDPNASTWTIPIECTKPEFPGAGGQGPQPMDEHVSWILRTLLDAEHTVRMGPGGEYSLPETLGKQYSIRSMMSGILRPRVDSPWQLGIHQCTHDRVWSDQEVRLFEEISNRLTDSLNDLLISRNLRESEARFRQVFEHSPVPIQEEDYSAVKTYLESLRTEYGDDLAGYLAQHPKVLEECASLVRCIHINHAAMVLHEADSKQDMQQVLPRIFVPETFDDFRHILVSLIGGETNIRKESVLQTLHGRRYAIEAFLSVSPGQEESLSNVLVSLIDITELKQAELERQQHLHFLESLDRINQVLQAEGDVEEILQHTLDEVLAIFDCDRAYLQYPCDPDAASEWRMPMEVWKPDYPSPLPPRKNLPYHPHIEETMRALLETDTPIQLGPHTDRPIPDDITKNLGVRSLLAVSIQPKVDRPWQFGIHQCSHARIWTDQEARLLEEIAHRLSDGLNNLLIARDLRQSEERFRLVFESSPVSIQEEDYSAVKTHLEALSSEYGDDLAGYLSNHPDVVAECASMVRMVDVNQAALALHEAEDKQALLKGLPQIFIPETMAAYRQVLVCLMQGKTRFRIESEIKTLTGRRHHIDTFVSVCTGYEQSLGQVLVSLVDISELKQAELERQQHLHFLESLDRINRVLQEEGNIEQIMNRALDEVLDIFSCDRVYLLYPCDPDSAYWSIPMERCKPEYPGVLELGIDMPMNEMVAWEAKLVLENEHPVRVGPGTEYPVAEFLQKDFSTRSFMAMALYPRVDNPWQLGIHQCSYDRVWSDQELRLFEEIGHRLSDGLNDLLVMRNLRESEQRFRLVYENSPVSIWEEDFSAVKSKLNGLIKSHGDDLEHYLLQHPEIVKQLASMVRILSVNSATLELHEAESKEALYQGLPHTFIPESYDTFRKELIAIAAGKTELVLDGAVQTLKGQRREVSVSFSVCPGYEESLSKVFVSLFDITQRKQDEERLRLAASVFSTSQEGILISDAQNRIIDINPAFSRLTGYSREEALGQNPGFLSAGQQNPVFYQQMWQSLNTKGEWQGELWNRRKSGEVFPELLSIVAVRDQQGQLQHYVGAFSDISMLKQHEADLDRIAHYDTLTSVPNRRLLGDRLEQAISYSRRHNTHLAVCYLDLDGFKPINDQFGHEGGDRMLIEIANRLLSMSRGEDTVARLGGDEFVLLWNEIESDDDCARALERILDKVSQPMLLEGEQVSVSASIGVTLYPDDNVDADSLLRHADHAMYTAKQLGKNRYQIFDARLERQISARTELMTMLERGLEKGEFELYYQPKVDFTKGEVVGLEALLRWNDPVLGLILPNEFLTLIENDSLAIRVGRLVIEEAIRQAKSWDDQGIELPISINIFPRHLKSRNFIADLRRAVASYWPQMPSHRLMIEIIETSELEELEPIEEVINECLTMGIGFSLDDFGTGYSSLVYLRRLSIEELKIDQSFVRDMLEDPDDEAIVVGVISLGKAFGLHVVAEGVENSQQAEYLVDLGCNIVQGYGLGRPMPVHAFQKWYADYLANEIRVCQD